MYEEPYRWIEAVGNRRQYLDDQFKQGSPIVGLSFQGGILLLTFSRGTPKLYEIYDRIALGGMGHPADLEQLRFTLLDVAHVEGFNRSPSDVTGNRLMKYSLAPMIKQAFEEIFKAPLIAKIILADIGMEPERDVFLTIDYDGSFEEGHEVSVVAANHAIQRRMLAFLNSQPQESKQSLSSAFEIALKAWGIGSLAHQPENSEGLQTGKSQSAEGSPPGDELDAKELVEHLRVALSEKSLECVLLDRTIPSSSKYRRLLPEETQQYLPALLKPTT